MNELNSLQLKSLRRFCYNQTPVHYSYKEERHQIVFDRSSSFMLVTFKMDVLGVITDIKSLDVTQFYKDYKIGRD